MKRQKKPRRINISKPAKKKKEKGVNSGKGKEMWCSSYLLRPQPDTKGSLIYDNTQAKVSYSCRRGPAAKATMLLSGNNLSVASMFLSR